MLKNLPKEKYFWINSENKKYKLFYTDWGNEDDFPILCIHGLTRNSRDFDIIADRLVDLKFRVLCLDIVGRGNSDWTKHELYNYHNYSQDILLFLKELNINRLHWIGTSLGGILSMFIASVKPFLIDKLILNDIGYFIPPQPMVKLSKYLGRNQEFETYSQAVEHLKIMLRYFGIKSEEHWQYIASHSFSQINGKYKIKYDPDISIEFKKFIEHNPNGNDLKDLWQKSTFSKALIIRGKESDILLPNTPHEMQKIHPNTIIHEIDNIGHTPSLMEDEQINPIISFIQS